jgi:hypothetical protein
MTSISITIPLPPRCLSPNGRVHWAKKAKATKEHRTSSFYDAREALNGRTPPGWLKASLRVVAYFPNRRMPDPTNFMASLKAAEDGIADAGIIVNDRALWPERPVFRVDKMNPRVELTISAE